MIQRTSKQHIKEVLANNEFDVVDLGCSRGCWQEAQTAVDLDPQYESLYQDKKFVCSNVESTPFNNGEFDFAIASHIAEHVTSPDVFIEELTRIAASGYIEVPAPLFDNMVFGNQYHHRWWVTFDDIEQSIIFRPQTSVLFEAFTIDEWNLFSYYFRESAVTELYWENTIDYKILPEIPEPDIKITAAKTRFNQKLTQIILTTLQDLGMEQEEIGNYIDNLLG